MADDAGQGEGTLTWHMTISREEFLRCLSGAVGFVTFRVTGDRIEYGDSVRGWRIELLALPDHCVGALRLPRHDVEFRFFGYSPAEVNAFMARMELYFRRGGG